MPDKAKPESEPKPKAGTRRTPKPKAGDKQNLKLWDEPKPASESEPESAPKPKPKPKAQPKPKAKSDAKAALKKPASSKAKAKPDAKATPQKAKAKPDAETEEAPKPKAKPNAKTASSKAKAKTAPRSKSSTAKKTKSKAKPKASAKKTPVAQPDPQEEQANEAVIQSVRAEMEVPYAVDEAAIDQALENLRIDISTSTLPDPDVLPGDEAIDTPEALDPSETPPLTGFFGVLDRAQNAMAAAEQRLVEEANEPPKSQRKLQIALIIGGLVVLLLAGTFVWYQMYSKVAVPDLVGMSQSDAVAALNSKHLKVGQLVEKPTVDAEPGTVVDQNPIVDVKVARGTAVTLTVAQASTQVAVPSIMGKTPTDANATLTESRLIYQEVATFSDTVPPGSIVGQLPVAGTTVDSGSKIAVLVSQGSMSAPVNVPKVLGLSKADATKLLAAQGFVPLFYYAQTVFGTLNEAVTQTPASTGLALPGSVVMVLISQGNSTSGMIVPDVTGQDEATATQALKNAGFNVDVRRIVTSSASAGKVVAQTPQAKDTRLEAGATVGVLVSAGTDTAVKVPSLLGAQLTVAQNKLRSLGLNPWTVPLTGGQHAGIVTQQFPAGGLDYQMGLPVLLYAPPAQDQTSGSAP